MTLLSMSEREWLREGKKEKRKKEKEREGLEIHKCVPEVKKDDEGNERKK